MIHAKTFSWAIKSEVRMGWLSPDLQAQINPYEYMQQGYQEAVSEYLIQMDAWLRKYKVEFV